MATVSAAHDAIERAVCSLRSQSNAGKQSEFAPSSLVQGHSRHELPCTVSFGSLWGLHDNAKREFSSCYIGSSGKAFVFSARLDAAPPAQAQRQNGGKKRARSEVDSREEAGDSWAKMARKSLSGVAAAIGLSSGGASECGYVAEDEAVCSAVDAHVQRLKISEPDADRVRAVLVRLKRDLRGTNGEPAVQTIGTAVRKLQASDSCPRIVIMARLHGGIAIPVHRLKRHLGEAHKDGVLTTNETTFGIDETELPAMSVEERASQEIGSVPLLLVTSIVPEEPKTDTPRESS